MLIATATIPGHHPTKPGFERSKSVPERTLRRMSAERKAQIIRETNGTSAKFGLTVEASRTRDAPVKTVRRRGSRNLLEELAPLMIPTDYQLQEPVGVGARTSSETIDDKPPQVPPKSPRTESRASPRSKKALHSANSSTSTTYSVTSPSLAINVVTGRLYTAMESNSSLSLLQTPNGEKSEDPTSPWVGPLSHPKNEYPLPVRSTSTTRPPPTDQFDMWHQTGISESSVIDRGRPMKRGDTSLIRSLSKPMLRSPSLKKGIVEIPNGFKAIEAPHKIAAAESRYLKRQADEQVKDFRVLPIKQVSKLSKVSRS